MVGFNDQDLVSRPDLFHQTPNRRALSFETARLWYMQLQMGYANINLTAHPLIPVPRGYRRGLEFRRYFDEPEGLDDVAFLDVVIPLETDATVEPLADLRSIIFESTQRGDLTLVDHDVVPE